MSKLSVINQNGQLVTNSKEVAEMTGKDHKELLRDIRTYEGYLGESNFALTDFFIESTYTSSQNKELPCYLLTRKGCDMVANKMTGEKGVLFTATYVTRFEEMEKQQTPPIQQFSPQLQLLMNMELKQKELEQAVTETKQEVQAMRDVISINPNAWRSEINNLLNKMAIERGGTGEAYREVREESYKLLDQRAAAKLNIRLTNRKRKVLEETGSRARSNKVSRLDVIADDKRLTEVYLAIVKEMAIKYKVA